VGKRGVVPLIKKKFILTIKKKKRDGNKKK
jgi:hypothetical protein